MSCGGKCVAWHNILWLLRMDEDRLPRQAVEWELNKAEWKVGRPRKTEPILNMYDRI